MRIQHNIAAMNAYRNYNTNTSAVNKNLEKLSSGYKINRAGDDAAGLAISEKMRAQISGLKAASKNVKDGISLVKTAEGAMQEVQDMLNRMVTLATQSANGTYDNEVDRLNLQKEVDQLRSEINRIADSSNFNGIKLMDGSQEIKTSYNISSPAEGNELGFKIISDGQLGVDPQAGVFTYDLSQLSITVKPEDVQPADGQNAPVNHAAASDWVKGSKTTENVTLKFTSATNASATSALASTTAVAALATGAKVEVAIGSKTFTVTVASQAATDGTKITKGTSAADFLKKVNDAVNTQIGKANAAGMAGTAAYTEYGNVTLAFGTNGAVKESTADVTAVTPRYTKGTAASIAATAALSSTVKAAIANANAIGATAAAAINGKEFTFTVGSTTVKVTMASDAVASTDKGSAALAAINAALGAEITKINDAAKAAGGNYNELSATLDSTGKVTATTTPVTDNKPAEENDSPAPTKEFTLQLGSQQVKINLGVGTHSGADIAKLVAEQLNAAAPASAPANQSMIAPHAADDAADTDTDATGAPRTLGGAAFTASVVGSTLTITMDEPPTVKWEEDMTLKFHDGSGNGGEQFKPTVDVEPIDSLTKREYAQATIDLTQLDIKDGTSIQLGNTTYTFAIGSDSRFKNSPNVVDLTDLTMKDFKKAEGDDADPDADPDAAADTTTPRGFLVAANRLSKAAAANSTFFVGSDTKGGVSLTEKEGAVDYAVNNLAGKDNKGTSGKGDGVIGGTDAGDEGATTFDSTLSDWKGLVKIGQASVTGNGLTLQIGDTSENYNQLTVSIGDIHTKALDIDNINISTQAGAQKAIDTVKNAINTVSSIRGTLGATQNRLEHTANNLSVMTENIQDAESTIRDTDIAEEMMAYTKNNILVQSAQAMLAQANQIPQGVLQLLG